MAALILAAGICVPAVAQQDQPLPKAAAAKAEAQPAGQPGSKIAVITAADLPVHTYSIGMPPSEFIVSDEPFKTFVTKVRANIESDLAKYDIQDPTTLKGYEQLRMQIAMVEGRLSDVAASVERVRALESKESTRLMSGQVALSMIAARERVGAASGPDFEEAFKNELAERVGALPWEKVAEEVKAANGRAQIIRRELILGQVKAGLDPVAAQSKGELSSDIAHGLVGMRAALDTMIPLQPLIASVYTDLIASKDKVAKGADLWTPMLAELTGKEGGQPVVVAIWDSGVDTPIFKDQLWTNAKEVAGNGKDDDGNGFVDDLHGIAFDLRANPVAELLHPVADMKNDVAMVMKHTKGIGDLQSSIESPEASELRKYMSTLSQDQIGTFLEDLGLAGSYSHGTHVAGIAAAGNPYARILTARISFDYKIIPQLTPTTEQAQKDAQAAIKTIEYFKQAGVRVVNMSWGGGVKDIEEALEKKGEGATPEARNAKARELFAIQRDALQSAIQGAPEILFVAAAGNSDNDNTFAEMIPSGLSAPNLITVGAVDDTLKPTSFTTFGKNVQLYANGFEVESYVPGGQRMKFSGTSMAAPNVANLAAKLVALAPDLTPGDIVELMKQGASPMKDDASRMVINPKKSIDLVMGKK